MDHADELLILAKNLPAFRSNIYSASQGQQITGISGTKKSQPQRAKQTDLDYYSRDAAVGDVMKPE